MKTVYLVSGPLGVGKTSVTRAMAKTIDKAELIAGDDFFNVNEDSGLSWEKRLEEAWQKILSQTLSRLEKNLNVVIDFVVEDELDWFSKKIADPDVTLKYVVLMTDEKHIHERLEKRNEIRYKDRSLVLLEKISKNPENKEHLIDTTDKSVGEIVKIILKSPEFTVT